MTIEGHASYRDNFYQEQQTQEMTKTYTIPNQNKYNPDQRVKQLNDLISYLKAQVTAYRTLTERYQKNENNEVAFDVWMVADETAAQNQKEFADMYDIHLEDLILEIKHQNEQDNGQHD